MRRKTSNTFAHARKGVENSASALAGAINAVSSATNTPWANYDNAVAAADSVFASLVAPAQRDQILLEADAETDFTVAQAEALRALRIAQAQSTATRDNHQADSEHDLAILAMTAENLAAPHFSMITWQAAQTATQTGKFQGAPARTWDEPAAPATSPAGPTPQSPRTPFLPVLSTPTAQPQIQPISSATTPYAQDDGHTTRIPLPDQVTNDVNPDGFFNRPYSQHDPVRSPGPGLALPNPDGVVGIEKLKRVAFTSSVATQTEGEEIPAEPQPEATLEQKVLVDPTNIPQANLKALVAQGIAKKHSKYIDRDIGFVVLYTVKLTDSAGVERIYVVRYYAPGTMPFAPVALPPTPPGSGLVGQGSLNDLILQLAQQFAHSVTSRDGWVLLTQYFPAHYGHEGAAASIFDDLNVQSWNAAADQAGAVLHAIPVGAAADHYFSNGDVGQAAIALAGDAALFAGPLAKALHAAKLVRTANGVRQAGIAIEFGLAGVHGYQGLSQFSNGQGGLTHLGEALLRLFGGVTIMKSSSKLPYQGQTWNGLPGFPRNRAEYDEWLSGLPTRNPPTTRSGRFQAMYAGPLERRVSGGGESFFTDGIDGSLIIETKFITNPTRSPFIAGSSIPDPVRTSILNEVEDEFRRMSVIIAVPNNPLAGVRVVVNDARAIPYFESLLNKYHLRGYVIVVPE